MWGATSQVSNLKSSTTCITDIKNNPDTRRDAPSLLRMHTILLQISLARVKFITTSGQSLSASKINCPRYLKEVTISRWRP